LECVVLKKIAKEQCGLGPEKGGFGIGGDEEEFQEQSGPGVMGLCNRAGTSGKED
jgi:hypothetical protein